MADPRKASIFRSANQWSSALLLIWLECPSIQFPKGIFSPVFFSCFFFNVNSNISRLHPPIFNSNATSKKANAATLMTVLIKPQPFASLDPPARTATDSSLSSAKHSWEFIIPVQGRICERRSIVSNPSALFRFWARMSEDVPSTSVRWSTESRRVAASRHVPWLLGC